MFLIHVASKKQRLNLGKSVDLGGNPPDNVAASAVPPGNGEGSQSRRGRVISVSWGEYTRQIGIDGTLAAIKEAIRAAFRLRTKCMFWLEDEEHTIRSIDCGMPIENYTLHIDQGVAIQICQFDEFEDLPIITEEKIFYDVYKNMTIIEILTIWMIFGPVSYTEVCVEDRWIV
ncbi:trihelix transcription factor GT-1 [Trifolium repens]|nr:trihelix transcription factor GT-1 [Trifolium repens]